MKKIILVFAFLFAFFNITSCSSFMTMSKQKNGIIQSNEKNLLSGDFNGDGKKDISYIYKDDNGNYLLNFNISNKLYSIYINKNIDSFTTNISDINKDSKDEFILYITDGDKEYINIYAFDNSIKQIFSSESIFNKFYLQKNSKSYSLCYENHKVSFDSLADLELDMKEVDIDYEKNEPYINFTGLIKNNDIILYTINSSFFIDKNNNIQFKDMNINTY